MRCRTVTLILLTGAAALPACGRTDNDPSEQAAPVVAAINSYLACAVCDLLGDDRLVLQLAGPQMCPGHFDIRPSQVEALRHCRVLLRMDFQESLDGKLSGAREEGLAIVGIRISGGLCEPESYLAACRQTADALVMAGLLERSASGKRLDEITARIHRKASLCRHKAGALKNAPVLASVHQEAFCRWLGLKVVATFSAADTAAVGQVDHAIRQGEQARAKLVIANLPEGRRVADALAERLGAKVVVFGNFPALNDGQSSFDDLLEANVAALMGAAGQ